MGSKYLNCMWTPEHWPYTHFSWPLCYYAFEQVVIYLLFDMFKGKVQEEKLWYLWDDNYVQGNLLDVSCESTSLHTCVIVLFSLPFTWKNDSEKSLLKTQVANLESWGVNIYLCLCIPKPWFFLFHWIASKCFLIYLP